MPGKTDITFVGIILISKRIKSFIMKNKLFTVLLAFGLMGTTVGFAQNMETKDTKSNKKERKAIKKEDKGKHHKALKKQVKAEKKEEVGR